MQAGIVGLGLIATMVSHAEQVGGQGAQIPRPVLLEKITVQMEILAIMMSLVLKVVQHLLRTRMLEQDVTALVETVRVGIAGKRTLAIMGYPVKAQVGDPHPQPQPIVHLQTLIVHLETPATMMLDALALVLLVTQIQVVQLQTQIVKQEGVEVITA